MTPTLCLVIPPLLKIPQTHLPKFRSCHIFNPHLLNQDLPDSYNGMSSDQSPQNLYTVSPDLR